MLEYEMDLSSSSTTYMPAHDAAARGFPFRVTEAGFFDAGENYFTRRDGKDAVLVMFTHAGHGEIKWLSQSAVLEPGSCVIISCDTYHEYRTKQGERWEFSWAHVVGDGLVGYRQALMAHLTPIMLAHPEIAQNALQSVFECANQQDVVAIAETSNSVSMLLTEMMRSLAGGSASAPLGREDVRMLADFIRQNCAQELSMDDFERAVSLSRFHLIRVFTRQMGMPPYKYMHACRILGAQRLLRSTERSVTEIAYDVGYSDSVNFIRHFRSITGTTPAKYRAESTRLARE